MESGSTCPSCNEGLGLWLEKPQVFVCPECGNQWGKFDDLSEQAFCSKLSDSSNWQKNVLNEYPSPIAHEYKQLQQVLKQGYFVSAMLQLKDIAEVLIKFSTVTMYQWLADQRFIHDSNEFNQISTELLSKPLSLGSWLNIQRLVSKLILSNTDEDNIEIGTRIANWLYTYQAAQEGRKERLRPTALSKWFDKAVEWRNREIGHGALRVDISEQFDEFKELIFDLHALLGETNPWEGYKLFLVNDSSTGADKIEMSGWESIKERHNSLSPVNISMHQVSANQLLLIKSNDPEYIIELSPFIEAKVCSYCDLKDIFVFDGVAKNRYFCIDYLSGHRLKLATDSNNDLMQIISKNDIVRFDSDAEEDQSVNQDAINESLLEVLEAKSLELGNNYTRPTYLIDALNGYLDEFDSGVFWLQAPGHVGKSTFIKGLQENVLDSDCTIIRFHISREYRYFAHHLTEHLYMELQKELAKKSGNKPLPRIDLKDTSKSSDNLLVDWINDMWECRPQNLKDNKLIVAIDGLDEVGEPKDSDYSELSIIDLLPTKASNQLNDGVHIVLTSRPVSDCPLWMQSKLNDKLLDSSYQVNIQKEDTGYQAVLKQHFEQNLKSSLERLSESQLNEVFKTLLDKSDSLFLYFGMLTEQLSSKQLSYADLQGLPSGKELYGYFIDKLADTLGNESKGFAAIKDILTLLTACEQAFHNDALIQAEAMRIDGESVELGYTPSWDGLDTSTLAGLLNEPHGAYSSQFIFSLFTIKSLMRVERKDELAKYKIGLKELSAYIGERWSDEVNDWHKRFSTQFYQTWEEVKSYEFDYVEGTITKKDGRKTTLDLTDYSVADSSYLNRYVLSHAKLADESNKFKDINYFTKIIENDAIREFYHHNYHFNEMNLFARTALGWLNLEIYCQQNTKAYKRKAELENTEVHSSYNPMWLKLAKNYLNRGELLAYMDDEKGAVLNYHSAKSLCELKYVGKFEDRVIVILKSTLNTQGYTNEYNSREEYEKYYDEALKYLNDKKLEEAQNVSLEVIRFSQDLKLVNTNLLARDMYIEITSLFDIYALSNNSYFNSYKDLYKTYNDLINQGRLDVRFELIKQYYKFSKEVQIMESRYNDLAHASNIINKLIEENKQPAPNKYRYYLALVLSEKWNSIFSPTIKNEAEKDVTLAANILKHDKQELMARHEYIPKHWDQCLINCYNQLTGTLDILEDRLYSISELLKLKSSEVQKIEAIYEEDKSERSMYKLLEAKTSLIEQLDRKRDLVTDLKQKTELNTIIIKHIAEVISLDHLYLANGSSFSPLRGAYISCANCYYELGMHIEARQVIQSIQLYFNELIEKEQIRLKKSNLAEILKSLGSSNVGFSILNELFKYRLAYIDCMSQYMNYRYLNEIDNTLDLDITNVQKKRYSLLVELRLIIDSMFDDLEQVLDIIRDQIHDINLYQIFLSLIEKLLSNIKYKYDCNQSSYGSLEYLEDLYIAYDYIAVYMKRSTSLSDYILFSKKSAEVNRLAEEIEKSLGNYEKALTLIDNNIKQYAFLKNNYSMYDGETLVYLETSQRISTRLLEEMTYKADMLAEFGDVNQAIKLYLESKDGYKKLIHTLPDFIPEKPIKPTEPYDYESMSYDEIMDIEYDMYNQKKLPEYNAKIRSLKKMRVSSIRQIDEIDKKIYVLEKQLGKVPKSISQVDVWDIEKNYCPYEEVDSNIDFSYSSFGKLYELNQLFGWERISFLLAIKNDIKKANNTGFQTALYVKYLEQFNLFSGWIGDITQDKAYFMGREYDLSDSKNFYLELLITRSYTTLYGGEPQRAIEQLNHAKSLCIDYIVKGDDEQGVLIELKLSQIRISFSAAIIYEILAINDNSYISLAIEKYAEALLETHKLKEFLQDKRESDKLIKLSTSLYESRATLYNKMGQYELASADYTQFTMLHYSLYDSHALVSENPVDCFLQGMVFIDEENDGFYDSRTFDLKFIKKPLKVYLYPVIGMDEILLKIFQIKFSFSESFLEFIKSEQDQYTLANILHALGNAFVFSSIVAMDDKDWTKPSSLSTLSSSHSEFLIDVVKSMMSELKIEGYLCERIYRITANTMFEIAKGLHTLAIDIMKSSNSVYPEIWNYDLNISEQLFNEIDYSDIPF